MVTDYLALYTPSLHTWKTVKALAEKLDWLRLTSQTVAEYFTSKGVGELFIHEVVEALTRVNYGQVGQ
jgi:prenylcysteine oxidase/farnesylcysteine lyase